MSSDNNYPDFLGIGAPRSGTTWLWENLSKHPEIWMPTRKEIHYFDRSLKYPSPSHLASDSLSSRLMGKEIHNKTYRRLFQRAVGKSIVQLNPRRTLWEMRYYLGAFTDEWYASLFAEGRGYIKGEITPAYSLLEPEDIAHIHDLMPDARFIYLMRNPIERTWSAVRKGARHMGRALDEATVEELETTTLRRAFVARESYTRPINLWLQQYPREQLFFGFLDEVAANPSDLLLRLFAFLGASADPRYITAAATNKYNVSPEHRIPEKLHVHLAHRYYPELKELSQLVGSYATRWLEEAESVLRAAGESIPA